MAKITATFEKQLSELAKSKLVEIQKEIAKELRDDISQRAPKDTGAYANSITVSDTKISDDKITTSVYTDYKVGDGEWSEVPLGAWLEWGTGTAGETTNKQNHGYPYRNTPWVYYNTQIGRWVFTHGMVARPHFAPAAEKLRAEIEKKILDKLKG